MAPDTRQSVLNFLELDSSEQIVEKMIEQILLTDATLAIIPFQDLLRLDSEARMNTPGTVDDNWQWQLNWDQVDTLWLNVEIRRWCERANRCYIGSV